MKETQNMYANDDTRIGQSRIKETYVVVTNWWYRDIMHLINHCHMVARGWDMERVPRDKEHPHGFKRVPPDFRMMAELIDLDLLDDGGIAYSQQDMPLSNKRWWRLGWWVKRLWRAIWMRERYKLDRYWMNQHKNPGVNK